MASLSHSWVSQSTFHVTARCVAHGNLPSKTFRVDRTHRVPPSKAFRVGRTHGSQPSKTFDTNKIHSHRGCKMWRHGPKVCS